MNNKLKKLSLLIGLTLVLTTGCATQLKDENNDIVKRDETGQVLISNILCQPNDEEMIDLYNENNVDISSLPECEDFTLTTGGYEGIWNSIFVKPLTYLLIVIGEFTKNYGIAIMSVTLLIRIATYRLTKKSAMQSENLKLAKPELDKLEKKYANKKDQETMMKKQQETMLIYKKFNINPLTGCLFALMQIPLFFAFYEALQRLPLIYEENFLGLDLGVTPGVGIATGNYIYLILIIVTILASYYSFKLNSGANMSSEMASQMKIMRYVLLVSIGLAAFNFASGLAIYWITNNSFTIIQNLIVKRRKEKNAK